MTRMLAISLVTLGDPKTLTGGYLYHQRLAELAPDYDARIEFVSFPGRAFPLPLLRGAQVLDRSIEKGPDVVVVDSIAAAYAAPWLRATALQVPVVAMLHQPPGGIDHGAIRTRVQAALDRRAYDNMRCLLVASESLADELRKQGVAHPMVVVPPGRDPVPTHHDVSEDLRRGNRAAFLSIGNWVQRKGILELLDAFARLPADTATLHLAGDDSADARYAARVRSRLAERDLAGRVVTHGRLAREEVAALYRSADAFALPAYREPYGTVWGEAMALGLPVVGWRAGNLPFLAEHEREALLVEPRDVGALSDALMRLASEEELRARLGAAAKRRALERPTWQDSAALFFAAVREALELHEHRPASRASGRRGPPKSA